jgi:hypothetical protein
MARVQARRSAREQHWRGIFSDWKASRLSVSAFCRNRNVAEASFYYWRRELAACGRHAVQGKRRPRYHSYPRHGSFLRCLPASWRGQDQFAALARHQWTQGVVDQEDDGSDLFRQPVNRLA